MTNYTRVQIRRGTAAQWAADNPIIANGEQTLETDTLKTKFGDGVKTYTQLPYQDQQGPTGPTGPIGATGPTGAKGDTGAFGGAIFTYKYLTDTADSDPGSGNLKFDNSLNSATMLYIDFEDASSVNNQNYLNAIDDSTSSIKGHFKIEKVGAPEDYVYYAITGNHYHHSSYFEVPVQYLSGSVSTIANNTSVTITFVRTGDKGDQGIQGPTGAAATISVGTTTVLDAGQAATVTNSGTENFATFDFGIPEGPTGPTGAPGPTVINWQGTWSPLASYDKNSIVFLESTGYAYIALDNAIATGDISANPSTMTSTWGKFSAIGATGPQGPKGDPNTLTIGTISSTTGSPSATITGTSPNQTLNLVLKQGPQGDQGIQGATVVGPTGPSGLKYSSIDITSATSKAIGTADTGHLIVMNNSSPITVTIDSTAFAANGEKVDFIQFGTGQISFSPSGVNLYSVGSRRKTTTQYSPVSLIRITSTDYMLLGDLTT